MIGMTIFGAPHRHPRGLGLAVKSPLQLAEMLVVMGGNKGHPIFEGHAAERHMGAPPLPLGRRELPEEGQGLFAPIAKRVQGQGRIVAGGQQE